MYPKAEQDIFREEHDINNKLIYLLTQIVPPIRQIYFQYSSNIIYDLSILLCDITAFNSWESVREIMNAQYEAANDFEYWFNINFPFTKNDDDDELKELISELVYTIEMKSTIIDKMIRYGLTPTEYYHEYGIFTKFTNIVWKIKEIGIRNHYICNLLVKLMVIFDNTTTMQDRANCLKLINLQTLSRIIPGFDTTYIEMMEDIKYIIMFHDLWIKDKMEERGCKPYERRIINL